MEQINYHNKRFKALSNSENGEVDSETFFHYRQGGDVIWATYYGTNIRMGTITGIVKEDSSLEFTYQHVNTNDEIMTGKCTSIPERQSNGSLILKETWEWTCKDFSKGTSEIIELVEKENLVRLF
ncbi:n-acetylglutamate synthase [Flammeovirga sp. EKP202]|uniref:n-acetylglutamate synthase n=1 Tax=Flammeovirga sp. EKP202 TaxID=2770592 RepID=UPI00165F51DD|nr:n-acetylglutamate synthase [Flammeovirga sp. EKP202]MBD0404580.1 n-acetylglutamate synthase [Flammeovirga sp. EKP202]